MSAAIDGGAEHRTAGGLTRGASWSVGGQGLSLVTSMLSTPFVVRILGPSEYGIWVLVLTVFRYVWLAEFGLGSATTHFGSEAVQAGDAEAENRVISAALGIVLVTTGVACVAAWLLAGSIIGWVGIGERHAAAAAWAIRLAAVGAMGGGVAVVLATPLQARQRWRAASGVLYLPSILQSCGFPVALALGGGISALAGVQAGFAIVAAITALGLLRGVPTVRLRLPSRAMVRTLAAYVGPAAGVALVTIPLTTADRILLARFDGTVSVGYYGIAVAASSALASVGAALLQPLIVAFTQAADTPEAGGDLFWRAVRVTAVLTFAPCAVLAAVATPVLHLWAGADYARHSAGLLRILLVGCWFQILGTVAVAQILASRRVRAFSLLLLAQLLPMLALTVGLIYWLGPTGAALAFSGRMASEAFFNLLIVSRLPGLRGTRARLLPTVADLRGAAGIGWQAVAPVRLHGTTK